MFQTPEPTAELTLSTPALLFPAISLLLLAYTNRFMGLASLIRDLEPKYRSTHDTYLRTQIENLSRRVLLIRNMQVAGVASLFFCVLCMLVLFIGAPIAGKVLFTISLLLMLTSLALSMRELQISVGALHVQLQDLAERNDPG
ncbi:MAG: DUF2721 domain-containing protein [Halorhodospira sp.]